MPAPFQAVGPPRFQGHARAVREATGGARAKVDARRGAAATGEEEGEEEGAFHR